MVCITENAVAVSYSEWEIVCLQGDDDSISRSSAGRIREWQRVLYFFSAVLVHWIVTLEYRVLHWIHVVLILPS